MIRDVCDDVERALNAGDCDDVHDLKIKKIKTIFIVMQKTEQFRLKVSFYFLDDDDALSEPLRDGVFLFRDHRKNGGDGHLSYDGVDILHGDYVLYHHDANFPYDDVVRFHDDVGHLHDDDVVCLHGDVYYLRGYVVRFHDDVLCLYGDVDRLHDDVGCLHGGVGRLHGIVGLLHDHEIFLRLNDDDDDGRNDRALVDFLFCDDNDRDVYRVDDLSDHLHCGDEAFHRNDFSNRDDSHRAEVLLYFKNMRDNIIAKKKQKNKPISYNALFKKLVRSY